MFDLPFGVLATFVTLGLVLSPVLGYRLALRARGTGDAAAEKARGISSENAGAALLALLGLLLAFTFSVAISHANEPRAALVEEIAAIGTAFLRADLVAEPGRSALHLALMDYAQSRDTSGQPLGDAKYRAAFLDRTLDAQANLWPAALSATSGQDVPPAVRIAVTGGVTDVLDAHTLRYTAGLRALPNVATAMILSVAAAALVIYGNGVGLQGHPLTWRTAVLRRRWPSSSWWCSTSNARRRGS